MDYNIVAQMLELDGINITHIEILDDSIHICVKSDAEPECQKCHSKNVYVHSIYIREDVRDRSISNKKCGSVII